MAKVGLFFGSFNPVHVGHLIIANYMANYTELDEVWFVVSPQNPFKKKESLGNMYDRLEMVNLAIEETENLKASSIEFSLPQPSYTIDTLTHLAEKYPTHEFVLIMGEDILETFSKWKNHDIILRDYHIYVYPRPGYNGGTMKEHPSITLTQTPMMELSSTFLRQAVKEGSNIKFYTPDKVIEFIEKKGLYS
ncbi:MULTISPECIES: nicotinate (nicotinamide) nucleotide adenylyltransferase [Sphingobacterium]|uniref:Probable nicotinate-nucleotide adenylyltransferase n=2 Tax=Sphingobacterium TaxID=28453 RepID=A0ABW5Z0D0_9SPHI|nr:MULTISPECIES: nicotinate (nicotinamide) nucleotide adenylyltransferase [Sphingobacterium]KKX46400.1 nicotinic acid mononucleotide adenylyltransferase [Sphingobacterium sp. IITKGP-BTPF85]MBB2954553.1 nicotinate-nucleotide adenylyltransferase [Sphingobacterium sp. JUb56]MCS3556697.1 nicotinate-nucleotide adenylyltransferase [Sphingobacterium sp. JUb21]MCW2261799.1 nicotinate-nucleotide adenylyltransferase [Sphingobacterium kitahiroshimense]NJI75526.1 nicotinate-nucleotide adenylyltransferase 